LAGAAPIFFRQLTNQSRARQALYCHREWLRIEAEGPSGARHGVDRFFWTERFSSIHVFRTANLPEENTMKKLLAVTILAAFLSPALAADEFYVVQDVKTKKCTIVSEKPKDTTVVTQVGPVAFKTRQEAEGSIKTTKVCTTN
jgi:hypothetical protein